jgi:alcohol dehydrogenase (cytochrome c)
MAECAGWRLAKLQQTPTSQRYSPLDQINTKNVGNLKVLCTYDLGIFTAFESGLIMVNGALIGTAEFEIFSINAATCALNWHTRLDYPGALLPANRGAAYMDGMLFRGTQDCRVLAFDFKTGRQGVGNDDLRPETRRVGALGADRVGWPRVRRQCRRRLQGRQGQRIRTGGKDRQDRLAVLPRAQGRRGHGARPGGQVAARRENLEQRAGIPISGGGTWTSYTLDLKNGSLYVPGGNPAPDFASGAREGENLFTDSVVVLDAKTGDFKNVFKVVKKDWHDWDVSNPPILLQSMGGKQIMAVAPKDGHLYGYDLATNSLLYRMPVTTIENVEGTFAVGKDVHFCPVRWVAANGTPQDSIRPRISSSPVPSTGAIR